MVENELINKLMMILMINDELLYDDKYVRVFYIYILLNGYKFFEILKCCYDISKIDNFF